MFSITALSFDAEPYGLTTPLQETPANIHKNLILPDTKVIGLYFYIAERIELSCIFIQIFVVFFERRMCFETESIMTLQGHPRSLILAPIEC